MSNTSEDILSIRENVGPKRVKTPLIETEQFDLDQLSRVAEKSNSFKPTLNNMLFSIVVPSCDPYDPCKCNCEGQED